MYSQSNTYQVNGDTVYIKRIEAGDGTGDSRVVWSDGYVENQIGYGRPTRRELWLRDRNTVTLYEANMSIQVSAPVEPTFKREPRIDEVKPKKPWKVDRKPPERPRVVHRPEFHARSNPRGR